VHRGTAFVSKRAPSGSSTRTWVSGGGLAAGSAESKKSAVNVRPAGAPGVRVENASVYSTCA
jgi:hypothetical protein